MSSVSEKEQTPWGAVLLFCLLFFVFGFVTWLNGPLIIFVKLAFNLGDVEAFLVPSVFYLSYFFLALPSALVLRETGMKRGMALGLLIMAIGAAGFGEFATLRIFPGALISLFTIGMGVSLLQTAANPYISVLGPIDSGAQRIAMLGLFNKGAGFIAPILVGTLILYGMRDFADKVAATSDLNAKEVILNTFAARVHIPYLIMAGFLACLAIFTWFSPLPALSDDANPDSGKGSRFAYMQMLLGFLAVFFYVGVEVLVGDGITIYANNFSLPLDQTKYFPSGPLIGMVIGYIVGLICIPRFVSQEKYLTLSALTGIVLAFCALVTRGYASVGFVAALGLANAMMWPAIFPLGIRGLGKLTEFGSAFLVMGISGGSIIPLLFARLKDTYGSQPVYLALAVICYGYVLFFSVFAGRQKPNTRVFATKAWLPLSKNETLISKPIIPNFTTNASADVRLFAGVDGGGTRCRVRLRDTSNRLRAEAEAGPANIRLGLNVAWSNILEALDNALSRSGEPDLPHDKISVGLGLAGITHASDVERTINAGPRFARIDVSTDAHTACLGAFDGADGGILITGTGSAGYGWVAQTAHTVGGWGFEVGDDGSAAALGREAIRSALRGFDGTTAATDFTRAVIRHFGQPANIIHWVTDAKPRDFGTLAPLTLQYAAAGDPVAVDLVQQSANDLGRCIMRLREFGCGKVCLVGGMAQALSPWLAPWTRAILVEPQHDALEGAILMARGAPNGFDRQPMGA
jgi:glucose/galactose transporter